MLKAGVYTNARPRCQADFPEEIPSILGGTMQLRYFFPHVWTQPPGSSAYALYWSEEEKLGRLFPTPEPEELGRFYVDDYYTHGDAACDKPTAVHRSVAERVRVAVAWRGRPDQTRGADDFSRWIGGAGRRVCDVGCGAGKLLKALAEAGHEVVGVEPDAQARESARECGIEVLEGTGEVLPDKLEKDSFDLVTMIQAFEHVIEPRATFRNLVGLLKPGGLLLLETPNSACVGFRQSGPAWYHTDAGRHTWYFTQRSLECLMARVGMEPVECYYKGYTRQFTNYWIASEQEVWDRLFTRDTRAPCPRPSVGATWRLLWRTLLAEPSAAYDSVGVVARKPLGVRPL